MGSRRGPYNMEVSEGRTGVCFLLKTHKRDGRKMGAWLGLLLKDRIMGKKI